MRVRPLRVAKATYLVLFLGLALGAAAGCGDDESKAFAACIDGDTRECLGPGACKGAQACKADGTGFEPCSCEADGAGGEGTGAMPGGAGAGTNTAGTNAGGTSGTAGTDAGGAPGAAGSGEPAVGGQAGEGGSAGAGGSAPEYECHPVGNVGCDSTHNCSIDGLEPECVPAGTKQVLATCDATTECAAGLLCHMGNCLKVCGEKADCATADATIKCGLGFNNEELGLVGSCVKGCDVLTQDCPSGQACYLGSCLTPTLALTEGNECSIPTDCAEGLDCLVDRSGDGAADCSKYCSTAAQSPCGQGFTCYPLNDAFPTLPASWGLCTLQE